MYNVQTNSYSKQQDNVFCCCCTLFISTFLTYIGISCEQSGEIKCLEMCDCTSKKQANDLTTNQVSICQHTKYLNVDELFKKEDFWLKSKAIKGSSSKSRVGEFQSLKIYLKRKQ